MAPNPTADQVQASAEKHLVGLPISVVGPVEVGRLIRELDTISNAALQYRLRNKVDPTDKPKMSSHMRQTLEMNNLDILKEADRDRLKQLLITVRENAPTLHISFSADPSGIFVEKLVTWLRREIHPVILMTVGLQPNIGAGCVVRSTNRYFDCSLRQDFKTKKDVLMKMLAPEQGQQQ